MAIKRTGISGTKKVKLIETPHEPVCWFALCSAENSYRLSWLLNQAFGLQFNLNIREFSDCSLYSDDIYINTKGYSLLISANRMKDDKFILPKYKKFDFILALSIGNTDVSSADFASKLRKVDGVIAVAEVELPTSLAQNLLNLF